MDKTTKDIGKYTMIIAVIMIIIGIITRIIFTGYGVFSFFMIMIGLLAGLEGVIIYVSGIKG